MESELKPYLNGEYSIEERYGKKFYHMNITNKKIILAFSGIGKVNAGYTTTLLINIFKADLIISTGVSGGLGKSDIMDFVVASATCQHDYDTSAFGDEIVVIGTINNKFFLTDKKTSEFLF